MINTPLLNLNNNVFHNIININNILFFTIHRVPLDIKDTKDEKQSNEFMINIDFALGSRYEPSRGMVPKLSFKFSAKPQVFYNILNDFRNEIGNFDDDFGNNPFVEVVFESGNIIQYNIESDNGIIKTIDATMDASYLIINKSLLMFLEYKLISDSKVVCYMDFNFLQTIIRDRFTYIFPSTSLAEKFMKESRNFFK